MLFYTSKLLVKFMEESSGHAKIMFYDVGNNFYIYIAGFCSGTDLVVMLYYFI